MLAKLEVRIFSRFGAISIERSKIYPHANNYIVIPHLEIASRDIHQIH